ncbi:hypothetical protein Afer_0616 [Acidimicrobium ferrooxidans DSM 10331]|uniref:Cytochrome b561 bacterial/Ni-hydrogenase domain-containing protein n=2 Tax=Acidimicrobium ferrooxidans TaxID=53635 RepID=C7LXW2_ACIFD|nr:hypothetical protein Afer_0616 [Acidimicrobium ferrooxidans DSM 10331]
MLSRMIDTMLADRSPAEEYGASRRVRAVARIMSLLGVVLFVGLAIEGVTILFIGQLISIHILIGMVLIPVMGYKIIVATYRFAMYYLGVSDFKRAGPPEPLLRAIGPFVVLSTIVLMGSGVVLALLPPQSVEVATWRALHQESFIVWFALMTIHVLAYARRAFGTAKDDVTERRYRSLVGRRGRLVSVVIALALGVVLAVVMIPAIGPWSHYLASLGVR